MLPRRFAACHLDMAVLAISRYWSARRRSWWYLAPLLLYVLHALLFGTWIVDDAGISFVYARNLAAGWGLVSQPGLPPVEGYSNFLWVLLMVPFFLLHTFDPIITPKLVGIVLTGGFFLVFGDALRRLDPAGEPIAFVVLCMTALNTSFTAWTISGLENALYVALIGLLFGLLVRERVGESSRWSSAAAGAVVAGIALTRPDGVSYAVLYPVLTLGAGGAPFRIGVTAKRVALFATVFLGLFGAFLTFRVAYFGDLQPNTYYAKSAAMSVLLRDLVTLEPSFWNRFLEPLDGTTADAGALFLILLVAAVGFLAWRRKLRWSHLAPLTFAACAAMIYVGLPGDWMREFRFATPFFPFVYASGALLGAAVVRELVPDPGRRRVVSAVAAVTALALTLLLFIPRTRAYAATPAFPFLQAKGTIGLRFNRFAAALELPEGSSFMGADVGGALWSSRLRIYDLAGLTDRTVARTLRNQRRQFHDYVFDVAQPTFILVHSGWTFLAAFNLDPRFQRDYRPLLVAGRPGEAIVNLGYPLQAGVFVRKQATIGKEAAVAAIRAELEAAPSELVEIPSPSIQN